MSITLAQLEQESARRLGPYWRYFTDRQVPNTAQFTFANFPDLRSNIDSDLVTNLWMLRRGEQYGSSNIVSMDPVDRQRTVDVFDVEQGRVFPDRPWGAIPSPGEYMEFHHLNPDQELLPAVLAGLRRCFLQDTLQAQPGVPYGGIDLTAQFPWLTEAWQIARVRYGWLVPYHAIPWDTYTSAGHLILTGTYGAAGPGLVWIEAWRPAWSWVNGAESITGPVADDDVLEVDLDYAASAAHIEAWHLFPSRLQTAAAGGLQATRDQAAQEFSRLANILGPIRPREVGFQSAVRIGASGRSTWVNGPF
jgi:hypothetical protein